MRRFIVLIIMLVVPLQFAWSAAAGLHGHTGDSQAHLGVHTHDHAHHHAHHAQGHPGHGASGDTDKDRNQDGHHDHYHPVFSAIITEPGLTLGSALPGGPILHSTAAFLSRTPPLLDRPPLARA